MAWKQERDANMSVGYTGGWCLKYVQDAFGTDHPYATAIEAWNANVGGANHPDEQPPLGVTAPIYISLGNVPAGHVAIRLSDGYVASSTQPGTHPTPYFHKNVSDFLATYGEFNGGATYLGWSEYVGSVHVVENIENATADQINQLYQDLLGRAADSDGLTHYEQYPLDFVRQDLLNSQEYRAHQASLQAAPNPVTAPIHNPDPTPPAHIIAAAAVAEPVVEPIVAKVVAAHPNPLPETPTTTTKPNVQNPPFLVRVILFIAELFTKKK